jgi:biotin transport system substrate-specific component
VSLAHATTLVWLFVPGDLAKAVIAAVIAKGVHAGYPGLLAHRRRDSHQPTSV